MSQLSTLSPEALPNQDGDLEAEYGKGDAPSPHIVILLALYNGERFLSEQLASFLGQSHSNWSLLISDDGSNDHSLEIIEEFRRAHPDHNVKIIKGPGKGWARNFIHLLQQAPQSADYIAFSDQDDVWLPEKLARAVSALNPHNKSNALYCSRSWICDEGLRRKRESPLFNREPGFRNALIQNIGAGNTMVLNQPAFQYLQDFANPERRYIAHDWWCYQMVTGIGGKVIYDLEPTLLYRQHGSNEIGAATSTLARMRRIKQLLKGRLREWSEVNIDLLEKASDVFTEENQQLFRGFRRARNKRFFQRFIEMQKIGLYRQTRPGQWAYWLAIMLRKV